MNPWALVLAILAAIFLVGVLIAFIRRQSHWLLIGVGMAIKAAAAAALIASGIGSQRAASAGLFFFCFCSVWFNFCLFRGWFAFIAFSRRHESIRAEGNT